MRYRQGPVLPTYERVPMKKLATLIVSALLLATPAHAIVGGGTPQMDGVARAVVTIVGSRGNFCTGSLIAPQLVLTVAHCVQPGADYKIVDRSKDGQPQLLNVRTVAIHPSFNMQAMQSHRATADVALLQLEIPLKGKSTVTVGAPTDTVDFPLSGISSCNNATSAVARCACIACMLKLGWIATVRTFSNCGAPSAPRSTIL